MAYEFAGSLYRNERSMLDAIAHDWITSGGRASQEDVRDILAKTTDVELARECASEWELDKPADSWPDEGGAPSHMDQCRYGTMDLANAFGRFRADIEHDIDVEARGDDDVCAMTTDTRTTLNLPADMTRAIDNYWHAEQLRSRNEAIRALLAYALDAKAERHIVTDDMVERIRVAQTGTKPTKEQRRG